LSRPLPRHPVAAFARGLAYPARAFRLIRADPKLRRYALLPFLINLAVFGLALAAFVYWFDDLFRLVSGWAQLARPEAWYWLPLYWLAALVRGIVAILLVVAALLVVWFSFTLLGNVIASPFNELLSAATERRLGVAGSNEVPGGLLGIPREGWRAVSDEARKTGFFLLVQAALLPLNLVPVAGSVAYATLSIGFGVLFVALDFIDYPMSRRRLPFAERRRALFRHAALMAGFGGSLFLTIFIPGLSLICMPLGVVGGTLLYLDLEKGPYHPQGRSPEGSRS
jgi:CysZ protein